MSDSTSNVQPLTSCSAPGSLMLLGEHAVLQGRRALVCAINRRITVSIFPGLKKSLHIISEIGTYKAPLDGLEDHPDFRFVLDVVKQYPLEQGLELNIESEFSSDIGFGSSASVTVATHAAFMNLEVVSGTLVLKVRGDLEERAPSIAFKRELFKRSLATIHRVQGRGSGADVAASVFGGLLAYHADPFEIHPFAEHFPLTAVYSGSKMKTADVIRYLEERRALDVDYFERIFDRIDASVGEVIQDFSSLGKHLILNQKWMEEMGLCNAALAEIIHHFKTLGIPAKISGSGLGDCVVGLGRIPPEPMSRGSLNTGQRSVGLATLGAFSAYALQVDPEGAKVGSFSSWFDKACKKGV